MYTIISRPFHSTDYFSQERNRYLKFESKYWADYLKVPAYDQNSKSHLTQKILFNILPVCLCMMRFPTKNKARLSPDGVSIASIFFFFFYFQPIKGPRATRSRGLLNVVVCSRIKAANLGNIMPESAANTQACSFATTTVVTNYFIPQTSFMWDNLSTDW